MKDVQNQERNIRSANKNFIIENILNITKKKLLDAYVSWGSYSPILY
jgi:hypothetical protein